MPFLVKIPGGLKVDPHFLKVSELLLQILSDLKASGVDAKRVVTRLNNSQCSDPSPVFIGIVEDDELVRERVRRNEPDAGLLRFGDDNPSKVYSEAVSDPLGRIIERNWNKDLYEKTIHARALGPEIGCTHQRFIAIRIPYGNKHRHIGTLTVGFSRDPNIQASTLKLRDRMEHWAQNIQSPFVSYLTNTFELGGPIVQ